MNFTLQRRLPRSAGPRPASCCSTASGSATRWGRDPRGRGASRSASGSDQGRAGDPGRPLPHHAGGLAPRFGPGHLTVNRCLASSACRMHAGPPGHPGLLLLGFQVTETTIVGGFPANRRPRSRRSVRGHHGGREVWMEVCNPDGGGVMGPRSPASCANWVSLDGAQEGVLYWCQGCKSAHSIIVRGPGAQGGTATPRNPCSRPACHPRPRLTRRPVERLGAVAQKGARRQRRPLSARPSAATPSSAATAPSPARSYSWATVSHDLAGNWSSRSLTLPGVDAGQGTAVNILDSSSPRPRCSAAVSGRRPVGAGIVAQDSGRRYERLRLPRRVARQGDWAAAERHEVVKEVLRTEFVPITQEIGTCGHSRSSTAIALVLTMTACAAPSVHRRRTTSRCQAFLRQPCPPPPRAPRRHGRFSHGPCAGSARPPSSYAGERASRHRGDG